MVRTHSNASRNSNSWPTSSIAIVILTITAIFAAEGAYGQSARSAAPNRSAQSIVVNEYGLRQLSLQLSAHEVTAQSQGRPVTFPKALRKALECILSDGSRPTSPLAKAVAVNAANPQRQNQQNANQELQAASRLLARYMNQPSTSLRLVSRQYAPAGSPSIAQNWVFELKVPTLAEESFWIIVDKSGSRSTYSYGG